MAIKKKNKKGKYWYYISYHECQLCGAGEEYRDRRYTPKPKDPAKRREFNQFACDAHFM